MKRTHSTNYYIKLACVGFSALITSSAFADGGVRDSADSEFRSNTMYLAFAPGSRDGIESKIDNQARKVSTYNVFENFGRCGDGGHGYTKSLVNTDVYHPYNVTVKTTTQEGSISTRETYYDTVVNEAGGIYQFGCTLGLGGVGRSTRTYTYEVTSEQAQGNDSQPPATSGSFFNRVQTYGGEGSCGRLGRTAYVENSDTANSYRVTVKKTIQSGNLDTRQVSTDTFVNHPGQSYQYGCTTGSGTTTTYNYEVVGEVPVQ